MGNRRSTARKSGSITVAALWSWLAQYPYRTRLTDRRLRWPDTRGPIAIGNSRRTSDQPSPKVLRLQRQQPLQVGLDAVLLQAGVDAQVVPGVVLDLLDGDHLLRAGPVAHRPGAGSHDQLVLERARPGGLIQLSGL